MPPNSDYLLDAMDRLVRRVHGLEQHLWGPEPGKLGNQPIFSIPSTITGTRTSGGHPIYFNSRVFQIRAWSMVAPSGPLTVACYVLRESVDMLVGSVTIPSGQRSGIEELDFETEIGDLAYIVIDAANYGGGFAADATVAWRLM